MKKNKLKVLLLIMCLASNSMLLAGCGSKDSESKDDKSNKKVTEQKKEKKLEKKHDKKKEDKAKEEEQEENEEQEEKHKSSSNSESNKSHKGKTWVKPKYKTVHHPEQKHWGEVEYVLTCECGRNFSGRNQAEARIAFQRHRPNP